MHEHEALPTVPLGPLLQAMREKLLYAVQSGAGFDLS